MSLLTELPQGHFLLQGRPSLCCAAGCLGIDIYLESAAFLLGFQVLYDHFTIWHAQSAAWPRYRCSTEGFSSPQQRNAGIYDKEQVSMTNFLKDLSAALESLFETEMLAQETGE